MAASTGPILAAGGITFANKWLLSGQGFDVKILIATGFAAMALDLIEHASPPLATGIAWIALVTVVLTRVSPGTPSPVENLNKIL